MTLGKLKLPADAAFLPTTDGLLFKRHDQAFVVRGRNAYKLFTTLIPYLDGEHDLDALAARIGGERGRAVIDLLERLLARRFLRPAEDRPGDPAVLRLFAPQIEFFETVTEEPALDQFLRFRNRPFLLAGAGQALEAAAVSLLRNGAAALVLATDDGTVADSVRGVADALAAEGAEVRVRHTSGESAAGLLAELDAGLAAYVAEHPRLDEPWGLAERAARAGVPFVAAVGFEGESWIGPFADAAGRGCWRCFAERMAGNLPDPSALRLWRALSGAGGRPAERSGLSRFAARLLGNHLAFEIYKLTVPSLHDAGSPLALVTEPGMHRTFRVRFLPEPGCPACGPAPRPIGPLPGPANLEGLSEAGLIDPRGGVIAECSDGQWPQVPLHWSTATCTGPARGDGRSNRAGYSVASLAEAREQAVLRALLRYAVSRAPPDDAAGLGPLLTADPGPSMDPSPLAGFGAAPGAERALAAAIWGALAGLRLEALTRGDASLRPVQPDELPGLSPNAGFLLACLRDLGWRPWLEAASAAPGQPSVPVVVGRARGPRAKEDEPGGERWIGALAAGRTHAEALEQVLLELVAAAQGSAAVPEATALGARLTALRRPEERDGPGGQSASVPLDVRADDLGPLLEAAGVEVHAQDITPPDVAAVVAFRAFRVRLGSVR